MVLSSYVIVGCADWTWIDRLEVIDHFVTRGSHYVECQLMGEEGQKVPMFKIMGIFAT